MAFYSTTTAMVLRKMGTESVLIPVARNPDAFDAVFLLNRTGELLWTQLETICSAASLEESLRKEFSDLEPMTIQRDVADFLVDLCAIGAITKHDTTDSAHA